MVTDSEKVPRRLGRLSRAKSVVAAEHVAAEYHDVHVATAVFATSTSAHGFARAAQSSRLRRLFWIAAIMAGFSYAGYNISDRFVSYYEYKTNTVVKKSFETTMEFPAVTICNYNKLKRSLLTAVDLEILNELSGQFADMTHDRETSGEDDEETPIETVATDAEEVGEEVIGAEGGNPNGNGTGALGETWRYANLTYYADGKLALDLLVEAKGWTLIDSYSVINEISPPDVPHTLLRCTFKGKACDSSMFEHRLTSMGNCYTFSSAYLLKRFGNAHNGFSFPLKQEAQGRDQGLRIALDVQTWDYSETVGNGGNIESGVRVAIHSPGIFPEIANIGFSASPGSAVEAGFSESRTTNTQPPWGDCNPDKKLKYFDEYDINSCALECRLEYVLDECGCKPYYYPGDFQVCKSDQMDCVGRVLVMMNRDFLGYCSCPVDCYHETFPSKLSYASFPNQAMALEANIKGVFPRLNIDKVKKAAPPDADVEDDLDEYISSNVVMLDVFFEELSYTETEEVKASDWTELLGDLGGQLGLFIGCSVLTMFEFIEFVVDNIIYFFLKCRSRMKARKTAASEEKDDVEQGCPNEERTDGRTPLPYIVDEPTLSNGHAKKWAANDVAPSFRVDFLANKFVTFENGSSDSMRRGSCSSTTSTRNLISSPHGANQANMAVSSVE